MKKQLLVFFLSIITYPIVNTYAQITPNNS